MKLSKKSISSQAYFRTTELETIFKLIYLILIKIRRGKLFQQ